MSKKRTSIYEQSNELWRRLSMEFGGELIDRQGWRQDQVRVQLDSWIVTIDHHSEPGYKSETLYTRLRAPYVNPDSFRFEIYRETLFGSVARLLGAQDIETGYEEFDHHYRVKSNDSDKVRQLCAGHKLRALIRTEPDLYLHVRDSGDWFAEYFPQGVDELCLEVEGKVVNYERLTQLYVLFSETMHRLCLIGSAYEGSVELED